MASPVSVPMTFQDPSGAPLAGGKVVLRLSTDLSQGIATNPQVSAGITVNGTLDGNGSVTLSLWPTSPMLPTGAVYFVRAYSAKGQLAWMGEITVTFTSNYLLLENGGKILLENGGGILLEH